MILLYIQILVYGIGPLSNLSGEVDGLGAYVDVERILVASLEVVGVIGGEEVGERGVALELLCADGVLHIDACLSILGE